MTAGAPRDPQFYRDLDAFGQRNGVRPEDALYVWASESQLDPALSGDSRTFSTLMKYVAVPRYMSQEVWDHLPLMTHREQLPYVEAAIFAPARRIIGNRPFNSTFEVYLANAAQALLRVDGNYNDNTPMYVGRNYPDNWTMDNFPAGVPAFQAWYAEARGRGAPTNLRAAYSVADDLIQRGVLKGYVSLGDLRNFAKRMITPQNKRIADDAIANLNTVRSGGTITSGYFFAGRAEPVVARPSGTYTPDFDTPFKRDAPIDTRIATPQTAHANVPSAIEVASKRILLGGDSPPYLLIGIVAAGAVATVVAVMIAIERSRKSA
jgi:hypothetical protein